MNKTIYPGKYKGHLNAPKSKSFLQRVIAIAALSQSKTFFEKNIFSDDVWASLNIIKQLGAIIEEFELNNKTFIEITPIKTFNIDTLAIDANEAGLSARMFTPITALFNSKVTINGKGSLSSRPMDMVIDALEQLNINVLSKNNKLPLSISGQINAQEITVDGSESSQLLTGLLIALPFQENNITVNVKNLKSKPYIDLTLAILEQFNIFIQHQNYEVFKIKGNQKANADSPIHIEGDWSGAAFHLVAGAISKSVQIHDLKNNSTQADVAIIEALKKAGAEIKIIDGETIYVKRNQLNAFEFDASHCPDLFPPLAALAANCMGTSKINGVYRLKNKESDRAQTIKSTLNKLGINCTYDNDSMYIEGGKIIGGSLDSFNDHRIAMMLAVLAINAKAPITITNALAINKSYPDFYEQFFKNLKQKL